MDSKQIEKELQNELNGLLGTIKESIGLNDTAFLKERSFRNNPETGVFEGYTSAKFLIYPKQEDIINTIIEDFKIENERDVFIKSSYMGSDVDVDKITIALGVNGPEDYTRLKEAEKASGRRI